MRFIKYPKSKEPFYPFVPGTDATHAEHIETIKSRMYVGLTADQRFLPGELGMGLVEGAPRRHVEASRRQTDSASVARAWQFAQPTRRLQLHGLRDVQAEPSRRAGGRPEARLRGQEGQAERAATLHPEIQEHLCGVGQEGEKVCRVLHFLFRMTHNRR